MNEHVSLLDRTLNSLRGAWRDSLRGAWRDIAASARGALTGQPRPELSREDAERLRVQLRDCLEGRGGEVSARARAADLGRTYLALNAVGRERFLRLLAVEFDIDHREVARLSAQIQSAADDFERRKIERTLRQALEPPRVKLLTQFNALPEGVKFLVDMRAELMRLGREDLKLAALEQDLKMLLSGWFDIGFLELGRITWDSPAALLEKLMLYEAVHEIRSWTDLKNRLEADRRCFAFFHPRMPQEPIIFVEVALTQGMSSNVQALLDESAPVGDPTQADTANFYSISNCQRGLWGISFGDFLIKRVVDMLAAELPHLKTYTTLSPIPGFGAWIEKRLAEEGDDLLTEEERAAVAAVPRGNEGFAALIAQPDWSADEVTAEAVKAPLTRLCARYLLTETTPSGRASDPVAHFHLSNGARIERINWRGDLSKKGLQQSFGMMINYLYRLGDIEENHEAYTGEGRIAASSAVTRLAKD
ncbi:MAG: malonyl-CoA decarboxylase family protein [Alphaproteobacteria bacterium]|nr:malonyl-CoA decarboxylase family protein [Alphaproteobacteria bacterium]